MIEGLGIEEEPRDMDLTHGQMGKGCQRKERHRV